MHTSNLKQQSQTYQFSNIVCKETYNSLPKIYGTGKNRKPRRPKISTSMNVVKHHCSINDEEAPHIKKKPMKFHIQRIQYLSAPRYQQHTCRRKNCNCSLHEKNSPPNKSNFTKRLKPILSLRTQPDDMESQYKVRTKTENSPDKIGSGLLSLLKMHKVENNRNNIENSNVENNDNKDEEYDVSEVEPFPQNEHIPRTRTEQISYIKYLQSEDDRLLTSPRHQKYNAKTVQIQTNSQINLESSDINIINNNVQIQVNFQDAIEQHTESSKQNQDSQRSVSVIKQGNNLLIKNLRNKKNQEQTKKLHHFRRKRYEMEDQHQDEERFQVENKEQNQIIVQTDQCEKEENKPEGNTHENSRISSSLSMRSIVAKGLGQSTTKFKELTEKYQTGKSMKGSRAKSINQDGTFNVPKRHEYGQYLKKYKTMDKKSFNINKLVKSPLFKIVEEEDSVYFGELENDQKQGTAINITKKQIFEGIYENNKKVKGSQRNVDGIYKGYFENGRRQGYGTFEWNNGEKFQGNWKNGVKEGFGIWKSPKGGYYEGQWHNNRQQGEGTFKHKNSVYTGQFVNFLKHGKGKQEFINGDKYEGEYKFGKPDGTGTYTWHNGSVYTGEFAQGLRCGLGKWIQRELTLKNETVDVYSYQGDFKDDYKWGEGKQIDSRTGQYFIGEFIQGIKIKGTFYDDKGNIKEILDEQVN